jgi:hypothetical protein
MCKKNLYRVSVKAACWSQWKADLKKTNPFDHTSKSMNFEKWIVTKTQENDMALTCYLECSSDRLCYCLYWKTTHIHYSHSRLKCLFECHSLKTNKLLLHQRIERSCQTLEKLEESSWSDFHVDLKKVKAVSYCASTLC